MAACTAAAPCLLTARVHESKHFVAKPMVVQSASAVQALFASITVETLS
jgi:hypothetical protein